MSATAGAIDVTIVYAAVVEAEDQVDVVPLAPGRVDEILVGIGTKVHKGQPIAELSHGTLDAQLQQAEAMLAAVQASAKPNEIKARARLDSAQADLRQLLNPSSGDLQVALSAVALAESNLASTKTILQQIFSPSVSDLSDAQAQVTNAGSELRNAQALLDVAISSETSVVGLAARDISQNPVLLDAALANLNLIKKPGPADFAAVKSAVAFQERARARNQDLSGWQTTKVTTEVWGALLIARQGLQAHTAVLLNPSLNSGLDPEELALTRRIVDTNQEIIASLLAVINFNFLVPDSIRIAKGVESTAIAMAAKATAELQELQNPSQSNIALAENEVDEAQALLDSASVKLKVLKTPNPSDIANAEASVVVAEQALILNDEAYFNYDIQVAQSRANLVKQQLEELRVRAPFDGIVTQVWLSPGAIASSRPLTPIVTVISEDVVLSSRAEQTGIGSLLEDSHVIFTSPALPGQRVKVAIDRIAPVGDEMSHTFAIYMRLEEPDANLKPGMSGQVSISTRHENVVTVPKAAVSHQDGESNLFVIQDGRARRRNVGVGLINDKIMEIYSGIQPGDQVIVSRQNLLSDGDAVTATTN